MSILEKAQNDGAKIHLRTAGITIISGERDLEAISNEIAQDEKILCVITGKLVQISNDRSRGMRNSQATGTDTKGVLVCTDRKVIFADKRLFGKQITIIDADELNSMSVANGIISARLEIMSYSARYDISDLRKEAASDMLAALNVTKKNAKAAKSGNTTIAASGMDEIVKAKALFDQGIISQEEFESVKKKHL